MSGPLKSGVSKINMWRHQLKIQRFIRQRKKHEYQASGLASRFPFVLQFQTHKLEHWKFYVNLIKKCHLQYCFCHSWSWSHNFEHSFSFHLQNFVYLRLGWKNFQDVFRIVTKLENVKSRVRTSRRHRVTALRITWTISSSEYWKWISSGWNSLQVIGTMTDAELAVEMMFACVLRLSCLIHSLQIWSMNGIQYAINEYHLHRQHKLQLHSQLLSSQRNVIDSKAAASAETTKQTCVPTHICQILQWDTSHAFANPKCIRFFQNACIMEM